MTWCSMSSASSEACNDLLAYSLIFSCCCYTCCVRRKLRSILYIKVLVPFSSDMFACSVHYHSLLALVPVSRLNSCFLNCVWMWIKPMEQLEFLLCLSRDLQSYTIISDNFLVQASRVEFHLVLIMQKIYIAL